MDKTIKKPKVSILVPVYKVEDYLRQCLDSIMGQTFQDWECVIVDDGTPDSSGIIAEEYAVKDPRFRVIHQQNGGLAAARITLLNAAEGDYIAWVDSDDWIEPDFIETLYNDITKYDAEIAQVGLIREYVNTVREKPFFKEVEVLENDMPIRELIKDRRVPSYVWNKLYRRDVIRPNFPVGKAFEDIYAVTEWFRDVKKMVVNPKPLYHYRMRQSSIMNDRIASNRLDYVDVCKYRGRVMRELFGDVFSENDVNLFIVKSIVNAAKTIIRYEKDVEKRRNAIRKLQVMALEFPEIDTSTLSRKQKMRWKWLKTNPRSLELLLRTTDRINPKNRLLSRVLYK